MTTWMMYGLALLVLTSAGCRPSQTTASGTVTLAGRPIPEAIIGFFPTHGDGQTNAVKTDSNGRYKAVVSATEMSVTVSIPRQVKDIPLSRRPRGMSPDEWAESLPPRYSSREKTELHFMPKQFDHVSIDFALTEE